MKRSLFLTFLWVFLILGLAACSVAGQTGSSSGWNLLKPVTQTPTPTLPPTPTPIPPTATPAPTETPAPTATPAPVMMAVYPGQTVKVPILLYHHIAEDTTGNRYFVTPAVFAEQMQWLYDHHYQTITISQLADTIIYGGTIPERSVVITFDDGDEDVVKNALPIMQQYGYVGTAYIIVRWIGAEGFDSTDEINQLITAGWEIGSHSMSHVDLTQNEGNLQYEVRDSLLKLNQQFNVPIKSLAYPFGVIDSKVVTYTSKAGYSNAVGLGTSYQHNLDDLYYLVRMEVRQEYSLNDFIALLPYQN
jgi:peptidoglycan/xylan/chitin deacetylase (PgdA/CDA1 family)